MRFGKFSRRVTKIFERLRRVPELSRQTPSENQFRTAAASFELDRTARFGFSIRGAAHSEKSEARIEMPSRAARFDLDLTIKLLERLLQPPQVHIKDAEIVVR